MTDHIYYPEALSFSQGSWNWDTAVFYQNILVGDPSVAFNKSHATYDAVLATPGLSEYTHASYVADKAVFALSVNSLGQVVPTSAPATITYTTLSANTAQSGANMRSVVWCRQIGGAPAGTDPPVLWLEDNLAIDPGTGALLALNGDGTDFALTWQSTVVTYTSLFERYYHVGVKGLLEGAWNWAAEAAAGRLYMKLLVSHPSIAHDPTDATVADVLATTGLSEYNAPGYVSNEVLPPLTVSAAAEGLPVDIRPTTSPWEQQYTGLFPNTAQTSANVRAILVARRIGASPATTDPPVVWIERSVGIDPTDGSALKLNGGRVNAFISWPSRLAALAVA